MKWVIFIIFFISACSHEKVDLRLGYSPNLTHGQALIGLHEKSFEKKLGSKWSFKAYEFHAGPSIIEALFAKAVDVAYVGPIPAINSFVRSNGEFVIIAGAANGGGALVAAEKSNVQRVSDLSEHRVVTPQLGNTQDVTARAYFVEKGILPRENGGDLNLLPVSHPDQINLFKKNDVDLAWTVEPWVSRLVNEAGARILLDESEVWEKWIGRSYATTVIVARRQFVEQNPDLIKEFLKTHVELTVWMRSNPESAKKVANQKIAEAIGRPLETKILDQAWERISYTWIPSNQSLRRNAENAKKIGFLRVDPFQNWNDFYRLEPVRHVLIELEINHREVF